jgi:hypothetical protein
MSPKIGQLLAHPGAGAKRRTRLARTRLASILEDTTQNSLVKLYKDAKDRPPKRRAL